MRPSNVEFLAWVQNDQNKSKISNALKEYPNLANIKDAVGFNEISFLF